MKRALEDVPAQGPGAHLQEHGRHLQHDQYSVQRPVLVLLLLESVEAGGERYSFSYSAIFYPLGPGRGRVHAGGVEPAGGDRADHGVIVGDAGGDLDIAVYG